MKIILIDFENVQPSLTALGLAKSAKIKIFMGAHQTKVPLEIVQSFQSLGPDVEYIKIAAPGRDALDFHIAFYIGRLSIEHPQASFQIISKDTGFDPLITHLNGHGIHCERCAGLKAPPAAIPAREKDKPRANGQGQLEILFDILNEMGASKPKTRKGLHRFLKRHLGPNPTSAEVATMADQLSAMGALPASHAKSGNGDDDNIPF